MTELEPTRDSIVQFKIKNRTYTAVQSSRCGTCMHPARWMIESRHLQGFTYPSISRWVSEHSRTADDGSVEEWPTLSVAQIRAHIKKGHCPIEGDLVEELVQRRAEKLGIDLERDAVQVVDAQIASKMILSRAMERMVSGEIEPDVKDALAAAKLTAELAVHEKQNITYEQYQELFNVYFRTVIKHVDGEVWRTIMGEITNHPVVQEFQRTQQLEGSS